MLDINKNGLVSFQIAQETGLPIYDYRKTDNPGQEADLCDLQDFRILEIEMTDQERAQYVRAFAVHDNYRGAMPLYSLKELLQIKRS